MARILVSDKLAEPPSGTECFVGIIESFLIMIILHIGGRASVSLSAIERTFLDLDNGRDLAILISVCESDLAVSIDRG
jgi:hypothetical protein